MLCSRKPFLTLACNFREGLLDKVTNSLLSIDEEKVGLTYSCSFLELTVMKDGISRDGF
jgi:hypothetical protein